MWGQPEIKFQKRKKKRHYIKKNRWTIRSYCIAQRSILISCNNILCHNIIYIICSLKLKYFGHPMQKADSLKKTLMVGKIEGRRRRGRQRMRWLDGMTDSMDMSLSKFWEMVKDRGSLVCCSPWGHKESDMTERRNNTKDVLERYSTI